MRRSPSIVPDEANQDTYLVLDDLGWSGVLGGRPTRKAQIERR